MAQLRQDYQKFVERNTEVIAIGPEEKEEFTSWWHDHKMPFTGIPDPQHLISKLYNQKSKILKGGRMPAMALIDKDSIIRFTHFGDSMSDIPSDDDILSMLDDLNKEYARSAVRSSA
jgi:peroxiredoxin